MKGFRLGTILGLEIRIDASWLIIFFLVLWSFTFGVFPMRYPGLGPGVYVTMGGIGTILFFVSVLLHEMAHSVVAQARGVPVSGITLFVFGGMAHASSDFETPADEFVIAGVGPLSSLAIAVGFWGIGAASTAAGWHVGIAGVAGYLALLNVVLAIFNLLPGFPLDGGRLLRAAVWHFTGDQTKATRYASIGGRTLGFLLIGFGLLQVIGGALIGGLWMAFIGWFVQMAANSGYTHQLLRESLEGLSARDAMTSEVQTVPEHLSLREFVDVYGLRGRHDVYPVLREAAPVGVIGFAQVGAVPKGEWGEKRVADAMLALDERSVVAPDDPMTDVVEKVQSATTRRVLVVQDGQLLGIISSSDLARWVERVRLLRQG
jgi:Zn-dependent protease/CBS domain-containing protein